jgi:hypothetical protein
LSWTTINFHVWAFPAVGANLPASRTCGADTLEPAFQEETNAPSAVNYVLHSVERSSALRGANSFCLLFLFRGYFSHMISPLFMQGKHIVALRCQLTVYLTLLKKLVK